MSAYLPEIIKTLKYIFGIVTMLGGVIAIHEFGHFIFAKWCGIRVDTFSIGFGPKLFAKRWGETEYCLSLIPLGGFVKIYGQDPEELQSDQNPQPQRAFSEKNIVQKVSVLIGGPLFNYLLAVAIFSFVFFVGIEKLPAFATRVVLNTPTYKTGLRSGDAVKTIDGAPVTSFEDIAQAIAMNPGKTLRFGVERDGKAMEFSVPVEKEVALTPYGDDAASGMLDGLEPFAREATLATTLENHPWGFKNGDTIVKFNGTAVSSWEDLEGRVERMLGHFPKFITFTVRRDKQELELRSPELKGYDKVSTAAAFFDKAALYNPELFIEDTMPKSPAAEAGIKKGDRVVSVNGNRVYSFEDLRMAIQQNGENAAKKLGKISAKNVVLEKVINVEIERAGKLMNLPCSISASKSKDPLGQSIMAYTIGIQSAGRRIDPENKIIERTTNPFKAVYKGAKETLDQTVMTVVGIKKLIFGEVSMRTVGGPIMIGKIAGDAFVDRDWRDFVRIMAIISISLGVFNLLPVPILDGGHIVFAIIESIRGQPLSQNVMQWTLKVGLSLILLLMGFALFNDISRVLPF